MSFHEGIDIPFTAQGAINSITFFVLLILVAILFGIMAYFMLQYLRYNRKIVIWEDISGSGYQPTRKDKAMVVKLSKGGEEVLWCKKSKKYINAYGKPLGKRTYHFAVGDDGYWYNTRFGNLNPELKNIGLKPTSVNMRYQHVALQQTINDRYDKKSFWEQYGALIAYTTLILVTGIMMWLLFDKYIEISNTVSSAVSAAERVLEVAKEVLGAADNVQASGGLANA